MRQPRFAHALWMILGCCVAGSFAAAPAGAGAASYALLVPTSSLQIGCQDPCQCPIVSLPTFGSFEMVQTRVDPLYTYYSVGRYIASFNNGPGAVSIVGSGEYRIGGEVALVQQLTLDLEIQGRPVQHFDSGLVPVTVAFPALDIRCAVHGFYCADSVLVVNARPLDEAGTGAPQRVPGLQAVWPNPFRTLTSLAFTLDRARPIDLAIVDLAGRRVRSLAVHRALDAGQQALAWDGLGDDGRRAPAGVYWVVLRWSDGIDRRRLVKLD